MDKIKAFIESWAILHVLPGCPQYMKMYNWKIVCGNDSRNESDNVRIAPYETENA